MVKHLAAISIALLVPTSVAATQPARLEFERASEHEQSARASLSDLRASAEILPSVRKAIGAYESIVRHHPISAYSDDALWRAGTLALDAFARFGEVQDKETGLRLLRLLAAEYPTSKLAKRVPLFLASQERLRPPPTPSPPSSVVEPPAPKANARAISSVSPAASPSKPATITAIRRAVLPDVVRIVIALDSEVAAFHDERITGPARIFVDFPATRTAASLTDRTLRFDDDGDLVRQVRFGRHPNTTTRVVLEAAGVSSYSVYPLYSPYRLVIDCTRPAPAALSASTVPVSPAPLRARAIRLKPQALLAGVKPPAIPRPIELTLASRRVAANWTRTLPSRRPLSTALLNAASVLPLAARSLAREPEGRLPSTTPGATALIAEALTPVREPPPPVPAPALASSSAVAAVASFPPSSAAASPPAPAAAPSSSAAPPSAAASKSALSMARQLGLGVSRIVIDPGHGGHDPGAKGKAGVWEAELVLDVSQRLQKLLENVQGAEVILTREGDDFVSLPDRTDRANREGADLFLSIHANANANDQAHGVETYFLNFASNLGAAAVAARENAASGQAMAALPDFVKAIALNNKLDESRDFAALVQESMVDHLRPANKTLKNLGVKQAPFVVLIGASMPSVLVEISFVTNPQEARLLKNSAYRQKIAEALFEAVRKYQTSLASVRTIAYR